jgi:hypothetical protein
LSQSMMEESRWPLRMRLGSSVFWMEEKAEEWEKEEMRESGSKLEVSQREEERLEGDEEEEEEDKRRSVDQKRRDRSREEETM